MQPISSQPIAIIIGINYNIKNRGNRLGLTPPCLFPEKNKTSQRRKRMKIDSEVMAAIIALGGVVLSVLIKVLPECSTVSTRSPRLQLSGD
jgi:hypothetical protein